MSQHRIFGSETDQPRPLAYIKTFRPNRRRLRGYMLAAALGGILTLVLAAAAALLIGAGMIGPGT